MQALQVIAVSPTPEALCCAAACRKRWDRLWPGGAKLVVDALEAWAEAGDVAEAVVIVTRVADPARARASLEQLSQAGTKLVWLTIDGEPSVMAATEGLAHVEVVGGATLADALCRWSSAAAPGPAPIRVYASGDAEVHAFLRYKAALFFMLGLDPAPLAEAVDVLVQARPEAPGEAIPSADRASAARFRDADFPYLEGKSAPIAALKRRIVGVGRTEMSALVLGETGTGKEAVAFYLHEFSRRRSGPLVALNCAALDRQLLRSELFGHRRGAFTGATTNRDGLIARADGGTLFLDEIGDMPLPVQAALLRFLQTKRFRPVGGTEELTADVRVIAAGQTSLAKQLADGEFREDLYHRVARVEMRTPALREVPDDIPRLARHLVYRFADEAGGPDSEPVRRSLMYLDRNRGLLERYRWPGNVRELANKIERLLLLEDDIVSELADGSSEVAATSGRPSLPLPTCADEIRPLSDVVADYVRHAYQVRGAMTQAELAIRLGKAVNTLKRLLRAEG